MWQDTRVVTITITSRISIGSTTQPSIGEHLTLTYLLTSLTALELFCMDTSTNISSVNVYGLLSLTLYIKKGK